MVRGQDAPPLLLPRQEASGRGQREPRKDQVSEATGHLSPSLEARRSAETTQGRAAPWRLNGRVKARGAGGCGVWLAPDRFLLPSLEGYKDVKETPPRRLSRPVPSFPLSLSLSPFFSSSSPFSPTLPALPVPLPCPRSLSYPPPFLSSFAHPLPPPRGSASVSPLGS